MLAMCFCALPDLLAELRRPKIDVQRRGWMLALLFSITGCNDPRPAGEMQREFFGLLPVAHVWSAWPTANRTSQDGPVNYDVEDHGELRVHRDLTTEADLAQRQNQFAHCWDGWENYLPNNER